MKESSSEGYPSRAHCMMLERQHCPHTLLSLLSRAFLSLTLTSHAPSHPSANYFASLRTLGVPVHTLKTAMTSTFGSQIFPFMSLPAEIRNKIYRFALVTDEPLRNFFPKPSISDSIDLLLVNKQISFEAMSIFYGINRFDFWWPRQVTRFLKSIGRANRLVAHIGWNAAGCHVIAEREFAKLLEILPSCTNLRTLYINCVQPRILRRVILAFVQRLRLLVEVQSRGGKILICVDSRLADGQAATMNSMQRFIVMKPPAEPVRLLGVTWPSARPGSKLFVLELKEAVKRQLRQEGRM